jgi:hypothetical protein
MYMHDKIITCDQELKVSRRLQTMPTDIWLKQAGYEEHVCDISERLRESGHAKDLKRGCDNDVRTWMPTASFSRQPVASKATRTKIPAKRPDTDCPGGHFAWL